MKTISHLSYMSPVLSVWSSRRSRSVPLTLTLCPSLGEPDDSDSEVRARQFSDSSPAPSKPRLDKPASVGRSAAAAASASASVKVSGCLCHRHYTARLLLFCRPRLTMIDSRLIYAPCLRPSVLHIPVSVAPAPLLVMGAKWPWQSTCPYAPVTKKQTRSMVL